VRLVLLSAAGLCLGCSASELGPFDVRPVGAADAAASPDASLPEASAPDVLATPDAKDDGGAQDGDLPISLTWTAVNANIIEGDIVSIWGTSSADVYVGTDMESVYRLTNGVSMWTGVSAQVVGGGWGSDVQTVYAVGASAWLSQMGLASGGGLFHYTGDEAWNSVASGAFYAVWGSSPSDVYVVGDTGVLHSVDGGPFASESSAGNDVLSVWGTGPTDVYAATSITLGTILHSAGDGDWQPVYAEAGSEAWAVWSSEPGDAYALVVPTGMANPPAHIVHSTKGQGWIAESVVQTPTTLVALWGSGPHDVYAGGWHLDSAGKGGDLFHSTGDGRWTRVPLPGSPYDVRCVWGSSATDVYVGIFDTEDGPVLLHGKP
jgi:hypothetical protein